MEKVELTNINFKKIKILKKSPISKVFLLDEKEVVKVYNSSYLKGINRRRALERKIQASSTIKLKELVLPKKIVLINGNFAGYTMEYIKGESYLDIAIAPYRNLDLINKEYLEIEKIIKKFHKEGIIVPDLLNLTNIIVTEEGLRFIDYDGMQIRDNKASSVSKILKKDIRHSSTIKYCNHLGLYTEELDKKSLLILYILITFNNLINDINMDNNRFEKIDKLLEELNISQEAKLKEIIDKAYNPRNDIKNEYLEEAVKEIGKKYVLTKDRKLSRRKLKKYKKLKLSKDIPNTESIIYEMSDNKLLKVLFIKERESLASKLYTVSLLSDYEEKINIKELVIPQELVSIDGLVSGFTIPYIKGENLGEILKNPKVQTKTKIDLLKKIGYKIKYKIL